MNKCKIYYEENMLIFKCPACNDYVEVNMNEIYCGIFRHALFKDNFTQVNPHLSKSECDKLVSENKIYGCCRPFQIKNINGEYIAFICNYI